MKHTTEEHKHFKSPKQMVNWLMDNEGQELSDNYGRKWKYSNYTFYFKDIGTFDRFVEEKISCLHLFGTFYVPQLTEYHVINKKP